MKYLNCYAEHLTTLGYREKTIHHRSADIEQFSVWTYHQDEQDITSTTIKEYQQYLATQIIQEKTRIIKIRCLKRYFDLVQNQLLFINPCQNIEFSHWPKSIERDILTKGEVALMINSHRENLLGQRDKTILDLMYATGIRSCELYAINVIDINLKENEVLIKDIKNRTERIVPLGRNTKKQVAYYLQNIRPRLAKHPLEQALFLTSQGNRFNRYMLTRLFKRIIKRCAITKNITPHSLRHSCATHMLQNGAPIEIIQRLLGHQRLESTEIYTRVNQVDLKETLQKHHPRGK